MLYSYKGRVEYKDPNEMCSFINEYISNCISKLGYIFLRNGRLCKYLMDMSKKP